MSRSVADFARQLDTVAQPSSLDAVKREVAEAGLRQIAQTFATETDPYGQFWPEVKDHQGHQRTLQDSGSLKNSWTAYPSASGVRFQNPQVYAATQQYGRNAGSGRIQSRMMVPVASRGLGVAWTAMVNAAFTKRIRELVKL